MGAHPGTHAIIAAQIVMPGRLSRWIDQILSVGPPPADPLYVSNRTTGRRILLAGMIVLPCLPLATIIFLAGRNGAQSLPSPPSSTPQPPAAIRPIALPEPQLEIIEARVERGRGAELKAAVHNKSGHPVRHAEIVFELTDKEGSPVGTVSQKIPALAPDSVVEFELPIGQQDAVYAQVREIKTPVDRTDLLP
jgi:hypothetical protein